jgi:hypothetical protein
LISALLLLMAGRNVRNELKEDYPHKNYYSWTLNFTSKYMMYYRVFNKSLPWRNRLDLNMTQTDLRYIIMKKITNFK